MRPFRGFYRFYKQGDNETVTEFSHHLHTLFEAVLERKTTKDMQIMSQTLLKDHFVEQMSDTLITRLAKEQLLNNSTLSFVNIRD